MELTFGQMAKGYLPYAVVVGQMKEMSITATLFLLPGFTAARAEFQIMALGHNLLKLFRYGPGLIPNST
jgi:hypothetical protein